jgi:hypothetical protein
MNMGADEVVAFTLNWGRIKNESKGFDFFPHHA